MRPAPTPRASLLAILAFLLTTGSLVGCGGGDPGTGQQTVGAGGGGTTANTHLPSPVQPSKEPSEGPVDRRFPTAVGGWQLYFLVVDTFRLLARQLRSTPERIKENRSVRTSG